MTSQLSCIPLARFFRILCHILELEFYETGLRSDEQIDRVKELLTVHTDARVSDAPKQEHGFGTVSKTVRPFQCFSHASIGVQWRTLWSCRSVLLFHGPSQLGRPGFMEPVFLVCQVVIIVPRMQGVGKRIIKLFLDSPINNMGWFNFLVGENGTRSVMGHILSVGFSRKPSTVGTLLLCKICLSLLGMVWYYQKLA